MRREPLNVTGSALLVQRFLDGELSPDERVQLLARVGRDAALREQLLEMEEMLLDASRLPQPAVSDTFVTGVLERLPASATPSVWQRLADAIWAPRTLQWNMAGAAALTCLALLIATLAGGRLAGGRGIDPAAGTTLSPVPVLVRLVVVQPGARTVAAAGDFNGWNPERTPLEPAADGAWTVTIPLEPGRYEYMFVIDGEQWIADPFATEQNDDGFGSRNAVLDVRRPPEQAL